MLVVPLMFVCNFFINNGLGAHSSLCSVGVIYHTPHISQHCISLIINIMGVISLELRDKDRKVQKLMSLLLNCEYVLQ